MTAPVPATPSVPSPRDRLIARLDKLLPGRAAEKARELILWDADEYAAWMAELVARPDDRWEPK